MLSSRSSIGCSTLRSEGEHIPTRAQRLAAEALGEAGPSDV